MTIKKELELDITVNNEYTVENYEELVKTLTNNLKQPILLEDDYNTYYGVLKSFAISIADKELRVTFSSGVTHIVYFYNALKMTVEYFLRP